MWVGVVTMKAMTKIALVSAGIISMGALTACQSSQSPKEQHGRMMDHHAHKMSPEQREEKKQMRAEHREFKKQLKTACDNKAVGTAISFQVANKTIDGSCVVNFRPDGDAMKLLRDAKNADHIKDKANRPDFHLKRGQELTAEQKVQLDQQRAERKAQFEQKHAERQVKWEALQSACAGQSNGQQIKAKIDDKLIPGTCFVHFKPNAAPEQPKV